MALGSLASAALGLGGGGLEKLQIYYETTRPGWFYGGQLSVLFNPNEISLSKQASWQEKKAAGKGPYANDGQLVFTSSEPQTLTVTLFFDTYEGPPSSLGFSLLELPDPLAWYPFSSPNATSVLTYTNKIADLARVNRELHRPPICKLYWGWFYLFEGVLSNLQQNFTMFMPDGTPVRATLTCTFTEHINRQQALRGRDLHSSDVAKTRVVRQGDTLTSIAAEEYGDPTLWRPIARANRIEKPRALQPGQVLAIPPL